MNTRCMAAPGARALRSRHSLKPCAWLVAALFAGAAQGQQAAEQQQLVAQARPGVPQVLPATVVSASRQEQSADEVPATVTAIDDKAIAHKQPADESALFADEPDMAVLRDRRRYGSVSINIRGIEDNRVLQQVDGVRLPDFYSRGGPSNISTATRDAPEFSFLKRVEVLRGPASSLYGSDAIGGVVSYLTVDPEDILQGRQLGGDVGTAWNGVDNGWLNTASFAAGGETVKGLIKYATRSSSEMKNQGTDGSTSLSRTEPNPQDNDSRAWLAKLVITPAAGHRVRLTAEHRDTDSQVDVLRLSNSLPRVTTSSGTEETERDRYSIDYEWKPTGSFLDRLYTQLYRQESSNLTDTLQRRSRTTSTCSASTAGAFDCNVQLGFNFEQKSTGYTLQGEKTLDAGSHAHKLMAGLDYVKTESAESRTATRTTLQTGVVSNNIAGEQFPLHDFPNGSTTLMGLFLQDDIQFADGAVVVTPGLRFDRYKLSPESDPLFDSAATRPASSKSESQLSPKLSALWQYAKTQSVYAQWVNGFRAPNYEEVNGSFRNTAQSYGSSPNPDLKAETSTGWELGWRYRDERLSGSVAVYDNRYEDFIEQLRLNCPSDPACLSGLASTYQYRNLNKVRIYGSELRGAWQFAHHWTLDGALAWARGENEETSQPLNSVNPLTGSLGVTWTVDATRDKGAALRMRAAKGVERVDETTQTYFKPGGYAVFDTQLWWQIVPGLQVSFAINNLLDRKYWLWADVRQAGVTATEAGTDFYTQAGRTYSASLKYSF